MNLEFSPDLQPRNPPCAHCFRLEAEHVDRQCLFHPTEYEAISFQACKSMIDHLTHLYLDTEGRYKFVSAIFKPRNIDDDWRAVMELFTEYHWRGSAVSRSITFSVYAEDHGWIYDDYPS